MSGRSGFVQAGLAIDLPPHGGLVTPVATAAPQGLVYGSRLETPERELRAVCPWREDPRAVAPPPALDKGYGQGELGTGGDQDAGVHHTVLLGADELVSFNPRLAELVTALEKQNDSAELPEASGDTIAAEFERYLRKRGRDK